MKFSWTNLRISIAGAKLSHLVQKDKIWDHGSMTEQARVIFYLVQKARNSGQIDMLAKYITANCFRKLVEEWQDSIDNNRASEATDWIINEIAVLNVHQAQGKKPDGFVAFIRVYQKGQSIAGENSAVMKWSFLRQGDWWMLDEMKKPGVSKTIKSIT